MAAATQAAPTVHVIYSPKMPNKHVKRRPIVGPDGAEVESRYYHEFRDGELRTDDPQVVEDVMKGNNPASPLFLATVEGEGFPCEVCGKAIYHPKIFQMHVRQCQRKAALGEPEDRIDWQDGWDA